MKFPQKSTFQMSLAILTSMMLAACNSGASPAQPSSQTGGQATNQPASVETAVPTPEVTTESVPTLAPPSAATTSSSTSSQEDDLARVRAAKKLVVGTSADYVPFSFFASDFKLDGFDIALMRDLGKRMGVEVEFNDFAFDGLAAALHLKQVDVIIGGISITSQREQQMDFTKPYYVGEDAILALKDSALNPVRSATDMAGQVIGVQVGSVYETWLKDALVDTGMIPSADLHTYPSADAMLKALANKDTTLVVMDFLPAQAATQSGNLKIIGRGVNTERFGIAVRKGSSLLPELDKALNAAQQDATVSELTKIFLRLGDAPTDSNIVPTLAPATPEPTTAAVPTAPPAAQLPAIPACLDSMAFVSDLNLDDQNMTAPATMQPGQKFQKGWRVRNSGNCDWAANAALIFVRGNVPAAQMGGNAISIGRAVKPGEVVDFRVDLTAPSVPGVYQGFWVMRGANGQQFGEAVWVGIQVPGAVPAVPQPTPPQGTPDFRLRADATTIAAGQCTTVRWNVDNINSIMFVDGGNSQGVGGNDARSVCPTNTTTYILRVELRDGRSVDQPITINVTGNAPPAAGIDFRIDSQSLTKGGCTTLRWTTTNVKAVYLNQGSGEALVGLQANLQVCPQQSTTMTLRVVRQDDQSETRQIPVTVSEPTQPKPVIDTFTVDKNQVAPGGCVVLSWSVRNVTTAVVLKRGDDFINEDAPLQGSVTDCLQAEGLVNYTLIAAGESINDPTVTQSVAVNVVAN